MGTFVGTFVGTFMGTFVFQLNLCVLCYSNYKIFMIIIITTFNELANENELIIENVIA